MALKYGAVALGSLSWLVVVVLGYIRIFEPSNQIDDVMGTTACLGLFLTVVAVLLMISPWAAS